MKQRVQYSPAEAALVTDGDKGDCQSRSVEAAPGRWQVLAEYGENG
jgi:hypothetical protein